MPGGWSARIHSNLQASQRLMPFRGSLDTRCRPRCPTPAGRALACPSHTGMPLSAVGGWRLDQGRPCCGAWAAPGSPGVWGQQSLLWAQLWWHPQASDALPHLRNLGFPPPAQLHRCPPHLSLSSVVTASDLLGHYLHQPVQRRHRLPWPGLRYRRPLQAPHRRNVPAPLPPPHPRSHRGAVHWKLAHPGPLQKQCPDAD
mmetsp:Transcript_19102/g.53237  ORF Transcript_19102/g.53237 Transcript_19102/m.53237 type:complete len:200 (-) Transcript_19102:2367-2966(-)